MIWNWIPKNVFVGFDVLELGIYGVVAQFNIGAEAAINILKEINHELETRGILQTRDEKSQ